MSLPWWARPTKHPPKGEKKQTKERGPKKLEQEAPKNPKLSHKFIFSNSNNNLLIASSMLQNPIILKLGGSLFGF
jgi:hypothetical protein